MLGILFKLVGKILSRVMFSLKLAVIRISIPECTFVLLNLFFKAILHLDEFLLVFDECFGKGVNLMDHGFLFKFVNVAGVLSLV